MLQRHKWKGHAMSVKPIPEGFHTLTPYLAVRGAATLIEFLRKAFGAEEIERHAMPDGTIMNALLKVGSSMVFAGECPKGHEPTPAMLYLYVEDADATFRSAVAAGGEVTQAVTDQFYGDRAGAVRDATGNIWWIATRKEDVSPEELQRRAMAARK
jgi:uncharacterized glyoxalase superfamily protein PhnB